MMHNYTKYSLITPAKNEDRFIENTILSMVNQILKPEQWVIVSDGSTDMTDSIIKHYSTQFPFVKYLRLDSKDNTRDFSSKVFAFNSGFDIIDVDEISFIGNVDADVTFDKFYFYHLINEFIKDPKLGVGGGLIHEKRHNNFRPQKCSTNSVAGAVQLFRKECYEEIGGYRPLSFGGIDSAAEITARAIGWEVRTFKNLLVFHHRKVAHHSANSILISYKQGITHYKLGYVFLFQFTRCFLRIPVRPIFIGSLFMLFGWFYGFFFNRDKLLPNNIIFKFRKEQFNRLLFIFKKPFSI